MVDLDTVLPPPDITVDRVNHGPAVSWAQRRGIMAHYDDSSSDAGGIGWFRAEEFKLSYNRAYGDTGKRVRITRSAMHAAYHAGICLQEPGVPTGTLAGSGFKYGGANTAYFGLCIIAGHADHVTDDQLNAIAEDAAIIYRLGMAYAGWTLEELSDRIVGHHERAIFNPRDNPTRRDLWGKLGRKTDPIGRDVNDPVMSMVRFEAAVTDFLHDTTLPIWRRLPDELRPL